MTKPQLMIGLPLGTHLYGDDPRGLVRMAELAEAAGADGVVVADHVTMGNRTDRYSWGPFPFPPSAPFLEPLVVLTAIAAATERLKLGTGILIVPLRPAALLAKMVATLDRLSGGRVELGVGTGWQEEEFDAQGVDFAARGRILTDTIAACRVLWSEGESSFASETVSFEGIWCEPRPIRDGGPPVLFSGTLTPRTRRRVVELGDGWIPIMGETVEGIAAGVEQLRAGYREAGRDPSTLVVRTQLSLRKGEDGALSVERSLAGYQRYADAGVTDVTFTASPFLKTPDDVPAFFDRVGAAWAEV